MSVKLVGSNGDRKETTMVHIRCPLCGETQTMMPKMSLALNSEKEYHCTKCDETFSEKYLVPFWRGFETGKMNSQAEVFRAQMEHRSANRMLWAIVYSQEDSRAEVPDNVMAMAGQPDIMLSAVRNPHLASTSVVSRFMTDEERKANGMPPAPKKEEAPAEEKPEA